MECLDSSEKCCTFAELKFRDMDYTRLPRPLIYKERRSLEDFAEENEDLTLLIDNMISNWYFSSADGKERVLRCFNTAYYLCTLILLCGKHAEWNLSKYRYIAYCNDNKNKVYQAFTLSLVYIFLTHTDYEIPCKKLVEKLHDYIVSIDNFLSIGSFGLNDYYYLDAYKDLQKDLPEDWHLAEEFKPRTIDEDIFHDVDGIVNWYNLTNYYRREIVETIVNALGKDEYEKHTLIDLIIRDAERFYGSNGPTFISQVKPMLYSLDEQIYREYNDSYDQEIFKAVREAEDKANNVGYLQTRISELENEIKELKAENERLQKGAQPDNELQNENERLKTLYEAADKQLKRYQAEEEPLEELNEEQKLKIDERIIFVSALLGVSLRPDVINQKKLAMLIERLTGDKWSSIRPRIVSLNTETQQMDDGKIEKFSEGTQTAAKTVYDLIDKAVKGATVANKGYQCKQAMENINQTYRLGKKM